MKNRVLLFSVSLVVAASLAVVLQPRLRHTALKAATSLEEPFLHYQLGHSYLKGFGADRNLKEAEFWLLKAAQKGHAKAQYKLGNLYSHRAGMQHGLETFPEFWEDIPLDYEKAIKWYKLAAEQKYSSAYVRLGYFNVSGIGMPLDYKQSFYWYRKAAKAKEKLGCLWLGYFYSHGLDREDEWKQDAPQCWNGIILDYARALKWYKRAAQRGLSLAQYMTGFLYANGEESLGKGPQMLICGGREYQGIPLDYIKAIKWYTKAAKQGHPTACRRLGYFYYRGNYAAPQNFELAIKWYLRGVAVGDAASARWIAFCHEDGLGVAQNTTNAIEWYQKAIDLGDKAAELHLESCLTKKVPH